MKLLFSKQDSSVPISHSLKEYLMKLTDERKVDDLATALTFNFRDLSYSPEAGGYHPVEIRIEKQGDIWSFSYLTDFAYVGSPYPELAKEIDFDLNLGIAFVQFIGDVPINQPDIADLYRSWESNFMTYLSTGCFDEIQITPDT